MEDKLRQYIQLVITEAKKKQKKLTLTSQNRSDLGVALQWLSLNKLSSGAGKIKKVGDKHKVTVTVTDKSKAKYMIKDRFGTFIGVS